MSAIAVRHWVLPHHTNGHRARLLHPSGLALVALLMVAVQLLYNFSITGRPMVLGYATDITPGELLSGTNAQRVANGLPPLQLNATLDRGAADKAADMFAKDYWSHYAPDGTPPWAFFNAAGYQYSYAGENLAKDFDTSAGVMDGWMNSPGHRANILNSHYTQVGFAVRNGTLLGEQTTLVVAFYGAPLDAAPVSVAAKPAAPTPVRATQKPVAAAPPAQTTPASSSSLAFNNAKLQAAPTTQQTYTLFKPLAVSDTLGWGQQLTVGLLGLLMLVYLIHHYYAVRRRLGKPHHSYALVQAAMLLIAIGFIAVGSFGAVG